MTTPLIPITYRLIWERAWPIILANAAVPLLGLADTAIIGNLGTVADLGAIALGALIFNFVYWSFGFLRMGTTGFTAQAAGANDEPEVRATLGRALGIAVILGCTLILLQWPIHWVAFKALHGQPNVENLAADYFLIRIWGAPATLSMFALMGCLIGLGRSQLVLVVQVFLNGLNIALDFYFAGILHMGAQGIALGTAIAEWTSLVFAGAIVMRELRQRHQDSQPFLPWRAIVAGKQVITTLSANSDIMIRTVLMIFSFYWFTDQSAQFGNAVLGANHILLQLVSFSAFFLDGFAFVAESLVGNALGAKRRDYFQTAVIRSSQLAGLAALVLALAIWFGGPVAVGWLTDLNSVREVAATYLPFTALYVLLSVGAFQLDGIFIGATRTRQMAIASALAVATFLMAWWPLANLFGNAGLWGSFVIYVVARAVFLGLYYPGILATLSMTDHHQKPRRNSNI